TAAEARRDGCGVGRNREHQVLRLAGGQRERPDIEQTAVSTPLHADRAGLLAEVLDMQIGRPGLRAGPNRQRREADVLPGYAEPSTSTRLCRARAAPAGRAGCNAAATRTAAARSCRKSSQLGRKRCQGTLAWRSRIWLGQRCRAGTIRVGRRIFRKYSATIAG